MRARIKTQKEFMQRLVVFCGGEVTCLLAEPFPKSLFGFGQSKGIRVDDDSGILFSCYPVNKEIIIAARYMIDRRKALVAEKDVLFIGKVSAHTHIGYACQGIGKILKGGMKSIKTDNFVKSPRCFFIRAISQDYFYAVVITVLHFMHPELTGRYTVRVRQQDDLVTRFLDAHAQRIFFSGNADGLVFQVDDMQTFKGLLKLTKQKACVVMAIVIDDDDLVGAGVGLYKR